MRSGAPPVHDIFEWSPVRAAPDDAWPVTRPRPVGHLPSRQLVA